MLKVGIEPTIACYPYFRFNTYKAGALPLGHFSESLFEKREGVVIRMGRQTEVLRRYGWIVWCELKGHSVVPPVTRSSMKLESYSGNSIIVLRIKLCDDETIGQIHPYRRRRQTGQSTV